MLNDIRATWALLVGIGFMMVGNGLQGTLLGLRATIEGFPIFVTGVMMSGYFIGIFVGSLLAPELVKRVGHIRVFAALASVASITILLHVLYIHPLTWMLMRLFTGISYAGLYVVTESWLNDRAGNKNRGKLLALYMGIVTLGLGGGQFMLNFADPGSPDLFILVSVVVSLGVIPMLLTARPAPAFEISGKMSTRELFEASPLAFLSTIMVGAVQGTIFGLGAVYASTKGLDNEGVSIFMACILFGGLILQWPLGVLSDYVERRAVMTGMSIFAVMMVTLATLLTPGSLSFFAVTLLFGSMAMPIYSICIAYANDRLEPEQIVAASGSLVMLSGLGASVGPIVAAFLMSRYGANFYFVTIGGAFTILIVFAVYRMYRRESLDVEDQVPSLVTGQIGTPIAEISAPDAVDYVEAVASGNMEEYDEQAEATDADVERKL